MAERTVIGRLSKEEREIYEAVKSAFVFYFPLLVTYEYDGVPIENRNKNIFSHNRHVAKVEDQFAGGPNLDTIYSTILFDVEKEPVIFEKPATDRFITLLLLDAYGNYANILGSGGIGGRKAYKYLLTSPDYQGEIPSDYVQVKLPTNIVTGLLRVNSTGEAEDEKKVETIQNSLIVKPLSKINEEVKSFTDDQSSFSNASEKFKRINDFDVVAFFEIVNSATKKNAPILEDKETAAGFLQYGIGPGLSFEPSNLGSADLEEAILGIAGDVREEMNKTISSGKISNNWHLGNKNLVIPGSDYFDRASSARWGIGANPRVAAMYITTNQDQSGKTLSAEKKYKIHFEKDNLPPLKEDGYWSITAYENITLLLIKNEYDKYKIGDQNQLNYNEDGSLDLYLQKEPVDSKKKSNWLPISGNNFSLIFRLYIPGDSAIADEWEPPFIEEIG